MSFPLLSVYLIIDLFQNLCSHHTGSMKLSSNAPIPTPMNCYRNDSCLFTGMWTIWLCFYLNCKRVLTFSICNCSYFECWVFIDHNSLWSLICFFTDSCNAQCITFLPFQCIILKCLLLRNDLTFPAMCCLNCSQEVWVVTKTIMVFVLRPTTRLDATWKLPLLCRSSSVVSKNPPCLG